MQMDLEDLLYAAGLTPGDDGLWRDASETVAAAVGSAGVFVGWLDVIWPNPSRPEAQLQHIKHLPPGAAQARLQLALEEARSHREDALRRCVRCSREMTPGHMHSADVCQGCAERHLGVVH
jgi:hypothetical protein